jgi:tRNA threonylcarbamoyladenosine biosynthesis protein TsaE
MVMTHVPLPELPEFARNVRAMLKMLPKKASATTVWLKGNLGAGKTTFMQALGHELEVQEDIQSPTYVLMKKYELPQNRTQFGSIRKFHKLVHIDAYRLHTADEFSALKPEQFLNDPTTLVAIEWPEHVEAALPKPDLVISFTADGADINERYIEVV